MHEVLHQQIVLAALLSGFIAGIFIGFFLGLIQGKEASKLDADEAIRAEINAAITPSALRDAGAL